MSRMLKVPKNDHKPVVLSPADLYLGVRVAQTCHSAAKKLEHELVGPHPTPPLPLNPSSRPSPHAPGSSAVPYWRLACRQHHQRSLRSLPHQQVCWRGHQQLDDNNNKGIGQQYRRGAHSYKMRELCPHGVEPFLPGHVHRKMVS